MEYNIFISGTRFSPHCNENDNKLTFFLFTYCVEPSAMTQYQFYEHQKLIIIFRSNFTMFTSYHSISLFFFRNSFDQKVRTAKERKVFFSSFSFVLLFEHEYACSLPIDYIDVRQITWQ